MKSIIPYNKQRLIEVRENLKTANIVVKNLRKIEKELIIKIQDDCPHPNEYLNAELTNPYRDSLESENYIVTCTACDKRIREYNLINGREYEK